MRDLFGDLGTPLRALLVSACAFWLSSLWLRGHLGSDTQSIALVLAFVLLWIALGYVAEYVGKAQLPHAPVLAVVLMEWWTVGPLAVAAGATTFAIVLGFRLAVQDDALTVEKTLATHLVTAVTAFLTSAYVAWAADKDKSPVARRIEKIVQSKYQRPNGELRVGGVHYFKPESRGELLVCSPAVFEIEGWGHRARLARAKGIETELKSRASDA